MNGPEGKGGGDFTQAFRNLKKMHSLPPQMSLPSFTQGCPRMHFVSQESGLVGEPGIRSQARRHD